MMAWKELRESLPAMLLAMGVIVLMAVWPLFSSAGAAPYGFVWGLGFHMSSIAILFFIAVVLGVTAYAVEEEQETLQSLLARPIPRADIFATKLGVRLCLLFSAALVLGLVELGTGAWPIEWDIPAPFAFERWMAGISLLFLGLGLGVYFGRMQRQQTTALVTAMLVFAAGYVILTLSPLQFLFQGPEGPRLSWLRGIALPLAFGVGALAAAYRVREGHAYRMPRYVVGLAALVIYGLLAWSTTVIPIDEVWRNPDDYPAYWTMRFGEPEEAFQAIRDLYYPAEEWTEEAAAEEIMGDSWVNRPPTARVDLASQLLGTSVFLEGSRQIAPSWMPVGSLVNAERFLVAYRRTAWIDGALRKAWERPFPEVLQLMVLRVAGARNDPLLLERIGDFMYSTHARVKVFACMIMGIHGDETAIRILGELIREGDPWALHRATSLNIQEMLGDSVRPVMLEWALGEHQRRRSTAQRWLLRNGEFRDLELYRRSEWLDVVYRWERNRSLDPSRSSEAPTLEEVEVWDFVVERRGPQAEAMLREGARAKIRWLFDHNEELAAIRRRHYRARTRAEGDLLSRDYSNRSNLSRILGAMARAGDPEVLRLWEDTRVMAAERGYGTDWILTLTGRYYYMQADFFTAMAGLGEPGLAILEQIATDRGVGPDTRYQAMMLLILNGYSQYEAPALDLWRRFRDVRTIRARFNDRDAFLILVHGGHLAFIEPILTRANEAYQWADDRRTFGMSRYELGTSNWSTTVTQVLSEATGREFGWDLKAWTRWWEREKDRLAGVN